MNSWGEKRYYSLDYYLKQTYGEKLYKVTLNGGMTCPNRDGTTGFGGCIFCSEHGSGDFAGKPSYTITEQLEKGKQELSQKRPIQSFIAYFQAFTNTYGSLDHLEQVYMEAIRDPDVKLLSIATRPDCLGPDILLLLARINRIKPVWIELGLQTIHAVSADYIRRGYELSVFDKAVKNLRALQLPVIVHVILGLPGETNNMMMQTIQYLNDMDIQGIKLQLLHVLKGTDLAVEYERSPFHIPEQEEYIALLCSCITSLRPDIVIHRMTGDGPKDLLIAPLWTSNKRTLLNTIHHYMKAHDLWQGKEYYDRSIHTI